MFNTVRKISWLDATHFYTPPRLKFKSSTATTLKDRGHLTREDVIYPGDFNGLLQDAQCLSLRLPEVTSHATVVWTLTAIRIPYLTQHFYTGGGKCNCFKSKRTNGEHFYNEKREHHKPPKCCYLFAKPYEVTRQKFYFFSSLVGCRWITRWR